MAGKIWRYDSYDLRKFQPGDISTFIDIGACIGHITIMAKILNPTARIIAFEPYIETFNVLARNMRSWRREGIECHNIALGDGTGLCFIKGSHKGVHRFCTIDEKEFWPDDPIIVQSKTLANIFKDYKISTSEPYIIKIDCEGGERFLLQQEDDLEIIRGSVQTAMEIHLDFGGTGEQWKECLNTFKDSHELRIRKWEGRENSWRSRYIPCAEFPFIKGRREIELVNRDWIGPWPGRGM